MVNIELSCLLWVKKLFFTGHQLDCHDVGNRHPKRFSPNSIKLLYYIQPKKILILDVLTNRTLAVWEVAVPSGVGRTASVLRDGDPRATRCWASQSCNCRSPGSNHRTSSWSLLSRSCHRCLSCRYRAPITRTEININFIN